MVTLPASLEKHDYGDMLIRKLILLIDVYSGVMFKIYLINKFGNFDLNIIDLLLQDCILFLQM